MSARGEHPSLYVEGVDDCYALHHLLYRHDIPTVIKGDKKFSQQGAITIHKCKNDDSAIEAFKTAIRAGTGQAVGAVLDADASLENRWQSVCGHLSEFEIPNIPGNLPIDGFVGVSNKFNTTVGVWLMPDNEHKGKLEDFLIALIDENDQLIVHAQAATEEAKKRKAKFSELDAIKAIIHCWLAWQEEPGKPFGVAIKAHYFQHNSPVADRFVTWFKKLYGLEG